MNLASVKEVPQKPIIIAETRPNFHNLPPRIFSNSRKATVVFIHWWIGVAEAIDGIPVFVGLWSAVLGAGYNLADKIEVPKNDQDPLRALESAFNDTKVGDWLLRSLGTHVETVRLPQSREEYLGLLAKDAPFKYLRDVPFRDD